LFIGHDLAVVRHLADRIAVMYLGQVVELGASDAVCAEPLHPYTTSILASVPDPHPEGGRQRQRPTPMGEPASPIHPPSGCRFHPRCPIGPTVVKDRRICTEIAPTLTEVQPGRFSACHFAETLLAPAPVASDAGAPKPRMQEGARQ